MRRSPLRRCLLYWAANRAAVQCLRHSCLRIQYDDDDIVELSHKFKARRVAPNETLWRVGDSADFWAIVSEGSMIVLDGSGKELCEKLPGALLGGDVISDERVRQRALTAGVKGALLFTLSRSDLGGLVRAYRRQAGSRGRPLPLLQYIDLQARTPAILEETPLFRGIDSSLQTLIADTVNYRGVQKGDVVIREGDTGDSLFIVMLGELHAVGGASRSIVLNRFIKGQYFGELALILQMPRTADVIAVETSLLIEISKYDLDRLLSFNDGLNKEMHLRIAERVAQQFRRYQTPFFESMSNASLVKLASTAKIRIYEPGALVCAEGDAGHEFFLIVHGEVEMSWRANLAASTPEQTPTHLQAGSYFGDLALMRSAPRMATIRTLTRCVFMTLDSASFHRFFVGDHCTEPVAGACLRLRWTSNVADIPLTDLLLHPVGFAMMTKFCAKEHTGENIMFWRACEQFSRAADASETELAARARSIYVTYFGVEAKLEVNVSSLVVDALKAAIKRKETITLDMFDSAKSQVRALIAKEIYPRFIESHEYREFVSYIQTHAYVLPHSGDPPLATRKAGPGKEGAGEGESEDRSLLADHQSFAVEARTGAGTWTDDGGADGKSSTTTYTMTTSVAQDADPHMTSILPNRVSV
ncbi:unnamed protein product (mitochondrion) [Plasmodiophora brassicae]|uniref:Cyclic nucleotide-binding domain-containing protein n=1 Tax=Plasmodiophora brassicae TaxID=37360 RepID=A0A0G4IUP6_PLABS|nr:hypothetical protein PBRA_006968 [Plasmodiophora brassicae]SPQ92926.1 unnamed protein product [Plasmodiophora brassicae]